MHALVVGAGVVGVCTAWWLRERGFDVTVIERRGGVAEETSYGNAGVIAPGYATPWAAPGMPRKVLSYLFDAAAPVVLRPTLSPALWRWLGLWLRECELQRYRRNKSRMQRIAHYSREQLRLLTERLGIDYERHPGYLQLFRGERDLRLAAPARALLEEAGVPHRMLSPDEVARLEPALERRTPLVAALYLPQDESGSCAAFTRSLKECCERNGVRFVFYRQVERLLVAGGRVTGALVGGEPVAADATIVAAASDSVFLLEPIGIRLPLYPVKGYSLSAAMPDPRTGPQRALIDEAYKVAITPFRRRIRVAGTAELGNRDLTLSNAALRTLLKVAADWFPNAATYHSAQYWVGARPMLPDGPPVLGATPLPGLFLNVGHGSTGWAMACGSGRVVADIVGGQLPEIDLEGLTIERYRRRS
ncbi:MAG TPA: D-amino acid dehydrogenase [Burkholderiaceae bacterium]|nr:D-amino acid dehydrogenase [Burkholderiaceae bacterium]